MESQRIKGHMRATYKMGGSIGITLPQHFVRNSLITAGTILAMIEYDNQLVISRMTEEDLTKILVGQGVMPVIEKGRKITIKSSRIREETIKTHQKKGAVKWQK